MATLLLTGCQGQQISTNQNEAKVIALCDVDSGWEEISKMSGEVCDSLTFNVMTDNAVFGDEHQFARFSKPDGIGGFNLEEFQPEAPRAFEKGDSCYIVVCCHNATDPSLGDMAYARDVVLDVYAPDIKAGESDAVKVEIRFKGNWPDSDRATVVCKLPVTTSGGAKFSVDEATEVRQGESIWTETDLAVQYGQGLSTRNCRTYELCAGVAPGEENIVYAIVRIGAK